MRITNDGNVGIGVTDPDTLLELYKVGTQLKLSGGAADYATFAVAADGALTITTVDADAAEGDIILMPDGNVGIGTTTPTAKLHVDQSSTTAAIPVLTLDQADVSEEFIHFIGTAANEVLTQSLFKEDPAFSYFTIQGYIKVYVEDIGNQITDGVYYIPFGTNAAVP